MDEKKYLPDIVKQPENYPVRIPLKQYRREIINPPKEKTALVYRENSPIKKTENNYDANKYKTSPERKTPQYVIKQPPKASAPINPVVKKAPQQNQNIQAYRTNNVVASNTKQGYIINRDSGANRIVKTGKYDRDKYKNYPSELERFLKNTSVSIKPQQPVEMYGQENNYGAENGIMEIPETEGYYGESEGLCSKLAKWIIRAALVVGLMYMVSNCAECSTQKPGANLENKVLTEKYLLGEK